MTDDQFAVIGRDENGHPHVRYCLDPREVTVIRDPEVGDAIIGYVWEPTGPVPQPLRFEYPTVGADVDSWANPRLVERQPERRHWWRRWQ